MGSFVFFKRQGNCKKKHTAQELKDEKVIDRKDIVVQKARTQPVPRTESSLPASTLNMLIDKEKVEDSRLFGEEALEGIYKVSFLEKDKKIAQEFFLDTSWGISPSINVSFMKVQAMNAGQ